MSCWMISDAHADFLATAAVQFLGESNPQAIGQAVLDCNAKAIRARYQDQHGMAAQAEEQAAGYLFRRWMGDIDPADLFTQARCARYQCAEFEGWEDQPPMQMLARLITAAGYEDGARVPDGYSWGIDCHPGEMFEIVESVAPLPDPAVIIPLCTATPLRSRAALSFSVDGLALFDHARSPWLL